MFDDDRDMIGKAVEMPTPKMPDIQFTNEDFDDLLCEIKGLLVDIYGKPNRGFDSEADIDLFIDEVETLIKEKVTLAAKFA